MGWIRRILGIEELRALLLSAVETIKELLGGSVRNVNVEVSLVRSRIADLNQKLAELQAAVDTLNARVGELPESIALSVDARLAEFEGAVRTELRESIDWLDALVQTRELEAQKLVTELQSALSKKKR